MTVTAGHVETVLRSMPYAWREQDTEALADGINEALLAAPEGLTEEGAAAFLATLSQESGAFRYLTEAGTAPYLRSKPYYPYVGRTYEQITWKDNYASFGAWCKSRSLLKDADYFVDHPTNLADPRWAWLGGVWFWQKNGIWAYGNAGDFLATQQAVNLGNSRVHSKIIPAGMAVRNAWYDAWRKIGAALLPAPPTEPNGRPLSMAAATNVYVNFAGKQALKSGDNEIKINDKGDTSLVVAPNAGVDLGATVDVVGADGQPVPGVKMFFRVISYKKGTPNTTISSRRATRTDQPFFKGSLSADKTDGRSARLRLVVAIPDGVTGAVANSVQVSGWTL